jgi:fatty-acid desaturase
MIKISLDTKVKMLQTFAYVGFIYTMAYQFNLIYLLLSLAFSWILFLIGASMGLHKYSSHKSFECKHPAFKVIMLFCSSILSLGSNISWAATHRKHHQFSDKPEDPHSPNTHGGGVWRSIKLWFYYFPTYHINPRTVKDLMSDSTHKFFHHHYFKIVLGYVLLLSLIDIKLACYLYFVPVIYGFTAISYITVLAHNTWLSRFGYKNFDSRDLSFNSRVASVFVPGDGNHNNHHARPGAARNKFTDQDWDLGFWLIKLIGRVPNRVQYNQHFPT